MKTLNSHSGYLIIDHRDSPGLTADDVRHVPGALAVAGGSVLERDVKQCSHCGRNVFLEPNRVRQRAVCPKCHHYICDNCERARVMSGGLCVPLQRVLDAAQTMLERDPTVTPDVDAITGELQQVSRVSLS